MKVPVKVANKPANKLAIDEGYQPCDACGHSRIDAQPLTRATAKLDVGDGNLYLCDHHLHKFAGLILEHGYDFRRLV